MPHSALTRNPSPAAWQPEEVYLYYAVLPDNNFRSRLSMPPRLVRGADPDTRIYTPSFRRAFMLESAWTQIEPPVSLTTEELTRVRYGGVCEVCSRRDNWRLHRGQDTRIEVKFETYCEHPRHDRAEFRVINERRAANRASTMASGIS